MTPKALELSKYDRFVVYLAESSWLAHQVTNRAVFSSRAMAVQWARDQARGYIDWNTWVCPAGDYPYETTRDDEALDPTFRASWGQDGGGWVRVSRTEVCDHADAT